MDDIQDLTERCLLHLYRAEAMKENEIGKKIVEDVLHSDDELSIELVWDAIDQFVYAIKKCKGSDIELEAELNSHIGLLFGKVLKFDERATKYYENCLTLANTLVPRVMTTVDWYKQASDFLKEIQAKKAQKEEQDFEKMREKYKLELKTTFDEIRDKCAKLETQEFLSYIYEKFPPKTIKGVTVDVKLALKKQLQNALIHYHPDKNQHEEEKWVVLCNEITIYLNSHYYKFK